MNRQYFLRTSGALDLGTLDEYGMSGLFSKLVKALAKPFQKVFPAKTLLGKIMDPLGLTDPKRNLNLAGRVADVVGTAAALAAGAYAIGAATVGTGGGFWATTGAGAKVAGLKLLAAGKGAAGLAAGAAKTMGPTALAMLAGGQNPGAATVQSPQMFTEGQYGDLSTAGAAAGYDSGGGSLMPLGTSGGGGGAGDMPGATVPVEDTMPPEGPNWLLIGGIALAAALVLMQKKKGR